MSTPVLLLTAKGQVEDRIAGLDRGADDYLPKPFHNGEFLARVRALTRRGQTYTPSVLTAGNLSLDCSTFTLRCGGRSLCLGNREFQMLELLMRRQGHVIPAEEFMERIWGYDNEAEISVVWAYISYLRKKLEALGADVRIANPAGVRLSARGAAMMIRTLRRKFILIAMLSLLGTLTVLCAAICAGSYLSAAGRADRVIELLYQNNGQFPVPPEDQPDPFSAPEFQVTQGDPL